MEVTELNSPLQCLSFSTHSVVFSISPSFLSYFGFCRFQVGAMQFRFKHILTLVHAVTVHVTIRQGVLFESSKGSSTVVYMLPPILRCSPHPHTPSPSFSSPARMARALLRAVPVLLHPSSTTAAATSTRSPSRLGLVRGANGCDASSLSKSTFFGWRFHALCGEGRRGLRSLGRVWATQRDYRKVRRRAPKRNEKELELNVSICIEEDLPDDPEILVSLSLSLYVYIYNPCIKYVLPYS